MLERLLNLKTCKEFSEVSIMLSKQENKTKLLREIPEKGVVLSEDDKLPLEVLNKKRDAIRMGSTAWLDENPSSNETQLLHTLQLIGHVNPGISDFINSLLERTCL